jgi:putative colanic acid biosynthesis UDP-glucose lipid carrier transferase
MSGTASGPRTTSTRFAKVKRAAAFRLHVTYRGLPLLVAALDILLILASALAGGQIRNGAVQPMAGETARTLTAVLFVAVVFVGVMSVHKSYEPHRLIAGAGGLLSMLAAWAGAFLLLASGAFAGGLGKGFPCGAIATFFLLGAGALSLHRRLWRLYLPEALERGALRRRACALVCGAPEQAARLRPVLERNGYRVARMLFAREGRLDEAASALRGEAIDDVFLVSAEGRALDMHSSAEAFRALPIPVALIPDSALAALASQPRYRLGEALALEIQREPLSLEARVAKRAFDLCAAGAGLILLAPLMAAIALAIRFESPGPALFQQTRGGFNGRPFGIMKLRSMRVIEDGPDVEQARPRDSRVTRVGAFLRRTSLDELPQLINVLRGEMSLVGPRPHAMKHDGAFAALVENYACRHHVKAGVTGWAQVHGARGPTQTVEQIRRRVELDLWYVRHWSLALDLSILARTVAAVMSGRNAV